jgi:hypothetical protein
MDILLTVVGLLVLAVWAVLWVVMAAALVVNEPQPRRKVRQAPPRAFLRLVGHDPHGFR